MYWLSMTKSETEAMWAAEADIAELTAIDDRLRWVPCEACGGSGETIRVVPTSTFEAPHEYPEICGACEGTGRDCVEVSPVERDDDQPT
jgi:hypothetical protein